LNCSFRNIHNYYKNNKICEFKKKDKKIYARKKLIDLIDASWHVGMSLILDIVKIFVRRKKI